MNLTDYVISIALIVLVLRQIRGRRLSVASLLWPLALVGWASVEYLRSFPFYGNNIYLISSCVIAGLALGTACGKLTQVRLSQSVIIATATGWAVFFWVLGMSGRLVFGLFAEHGGEEKIYRFSVMHGINAGAWATALILMALCEVVSRTVILGWKMKTVSQQARA